MFTTLWLNGIKLLGRNAHSNKNLIHSLAKKPPDNCFNLVVYCITIPLIHTRTAYTCPDGCVNGECEPYIGNLICQ